MNREIRRPFEVKITVKEIEKDGTTCEDCIFYTMCRIVDDLPMCQSKSFGDERNTIYVLADDNI